MTIKGQAQYRHFCRRYAERLGKDITKRYYIILLRNVVNKKYPIIKKSNNGKKLFVLISEQDEQFVAVYDLTHSRLVTVYTLDMWEDKLKYQENQ